MDVAGIGAVRVGPEVEGEVREVRGREPAVAERLGVGFGRRLPQRLDNAGDVRAEQRDDLVVGHVTLRS